MEFELNYMEYYFLVQKFYGESPPLTHIQENTDSLKPEVDDKASSVRIAT